MADSITFTDEQLDDVIACVDYAIRQGAAYGHINDEEMARAEVARERTLDMLKRFAKAAAKRAAKKGK